MTTFWMQISRAELIYGLIVLGIATDGYAQNSTKCTKQGWESFGEAGRDVCDIGQALMDHCMAPGGLHASIKPVNASSWYSASSMHQLPDCACTMTMYNVLSVCAACQKFDLSTTPPTNNDFPSVFAYVGSSCGEFMENDILQPEPTTGTDGKDWHNIAPQWPLNLTDQTFDLQKARELISQVSSPNLTTTTAVEATPTVTETPVTTTSSSSSGPNVGAIAGGVVGGLAFLGAIIALLLFLRHRKRRTRDIAPSDEFLKPEYYATPPLLSFYRQKRL